MTVPPQAAEVAWHVQVERGMNIGRADIAAILEAAAPHIAAAERERIRQMAEERARNADGCGADAEALWAFADLLAP